MLGVHIFSNNIFCTGVLPFKIVFYVTSSIYNNIEYTNIIYIGIYICRYNY